MVRRIPTIGYSAVSRPDFYKTKSGFEKMMSRIPNDVETFVLSYEFVEQLVNAGFDILQIYNQIDTPGIDYYLVKKNAREASGWDSLQVLKNRVHLNEFMIDNKRRWYNLKISEVTLEMDIEVEEKISDYFNGLYAEGKAYDYSDYMRVTTSVKDKYDGVISEKLRLGKAMHHCLDSYYAEDKKLKKELQKAQREFNRLNAKNLKIEFLKHYREFCNTLRDNDDG